MAKIVIQGVLVGIEEVMVQRVNGLKQTHWDLIDNNEYPNETHQREAEMLVHGYQQAVNDLQELLLRLFNDDEGLERMDQIEAMLTVAADKDVIGGYL